MQYISTRGSENKKTASQAVIRGIAEDRGLYVPEKMPTLPCKLEDLVGKPYVWIAKNIIGAFFTDYTAEELEFCTRGAYDSKFEDSQIAPVTHTEGASFLELYHGKTAAFKDMALSILPYLLTVALKKEQEQKKICILTATSGDTGKAALEGFAGVEGTEIIVFYPKQGVSQVQERQMVTQKEANTHVFAIEGNFDDAQTGVKKIFDNEELAERLDQKNIKLSSANSINIGRLVPQVAYYVYAYAKMVEDKKIALGDKINIVVPTGNFGNILAGFYAKEMGIPIEKFICASNENKVLTDFINTGVYDIRREFHLTNSPSMDILISSNLERLLYHLAEDKKEVVKLMTELEGNKHYEVSEAIKKGLKCFYGGYATEKETEETISETYRNEKYLLDTHTAVACKVYKDYVNETGDTVPTVIVSTASAYKFAESVAHAIGINKEADGFEYVKELYKETGVKIPTGLKDLDKKEIVHKDVIQIQDMIKTVENL